MFKLNGKQVFGAFQAEVDGDMISFPSNWLNLATAEDLMRVGIVVVPDVAEPLHVPAKAEVIAQLEQAIQTMLDDEAQAKGYDNITSACSYAGAPNPFEAEAKAFITRRGNVWAYAYAELSKVDAGTRTMPTIAEALAELKVL